jgi:hypothetical protein
MNLSRAEMFAWDLMGYHGLYGWDFKFDHSITRLGFCQYRNLTISLSKHATSVNSEIQVLNTLLHEIAHALCGYGEGHGPMWKAKALEIGCDGNRLGHIAVKAPHKYQMSCLDCSYTWKYYRKPKLGPCYIHKCQKLLQRIGYTSDKPWVPVSSNLKVEALV